MSWWMEKRFRMIQNNLRDIDGSLDVDLEVKMLKELGADVVQIGCGGISAFTPTEQSFQKRTPYLEGDKFGEILEKCHKEQIRVIARFDVSKVHKNYLEQHPEWFSRSLTGEPIVYNDTVATCINGQYQQELALEIIGDIVKKYPVDGIFFNMFGYQTRDYDDRYIGICQCENCRKRFKAYSGLELPTKEDPKDPIFRRYQEFKTFTVADILEKIRRTVRAVDPEIAVSTYSDDGIDIIRCEANSAVDRPLPFWIYSASDHVASIQGTFRDKVASNCAINAMDIPYRFMGVSPYLNELRLWEALANGSNLDWCIIGAFPDYPDRMNFAGVKRVFHFHKTHVERLSHMESVARVLLLQPQKVYGFRFGAEYRGIFKMLKEEHIPFDVVIAEQFILTAKELDRYELVILPGIERRPGKALQKALLGTKAHILASGCTFAEDPQLVRSLFGISLGERIDPVRGSYLLTEPKTVFSSFPERDWVYLDRECRYMDLEDAQGLLPLVSAAMYGPPERCFGHQVTEQYMAAVRGGKNLYLPWQPGALYYHHGYEDHKQIFFDLAEYVHPFTREFETDAPACVEMFWTKCQEDRYLLQLINISGFNGTTVGKPIPLTDIKIRFSAGRPKAVRRLTAEGMEVVLAGGTETVIGAEGALLLDHRGLYEAYELCF